MTLAVGIPFNVDKKMGCDIGGKNYLSVRINCRFCHNFLASYFSYFYKIQALRYLNKTLAHV
jgi:hypothetical protein